MNERQQLSSLSNLPHRLVPIVRNVAASCQIKIEGAAVGLCAALAGIGRPQECVRVTGGLAVSPRLNLILAGRTGPLWHRLRQMVVGPIDFVRLS